jgi:serine/threonine protein kinase
MTPERFQQIDKLLDLALERPPSERESFLAEACDGDEALRQKLQSLLLSHEQARGFLTEPASDLANDILAARNRERSPDVEPSHSSDLPAKVDRYVVTEKLGGGGMGVVYAAYDPELNRKLAIKLVLPMASDSASASERRVRLLREAQAMAQLSHPNVIAIYDVGTLGEQVFLAMEHVEGRTLTQWLSLEKRHWREIVNIFVQAGRGLAAAHAAGIVHRDFKPDNVLVGDDGRVRVLDFGLARAAQADGSESESADDRVRTVSADAGMLRLTVTEPGKLIGTPAYMAPEQLMGQPGDARSDQFSFCVALYQGLYRELPFTGETAESIRVPARLRKVLLRGLSAAREDRFDSMDSLLRELTHHSPAIWRWTLPALVIFLALFATVRFARERPIAQQLRSLAVLPLENLSHDPQQDYMADGLTDELITNLSKISSLRVIARSSAMRYKSRPRSIPEIAKELNVDVVLEGTVLQSGDRLRIAMQLIDASTEKNLWAESYDDSLDDVLSLQNRIARAVIAGVRVKLTPPDEQSLRSVPSVNSEAYQAYLRGIYYWEQGLARTEQNDAAIREFERATVLSPEFALGYARLALAYAYKDESNPSQELATKAVVAAKMSLSLDPNLAEAYMARGRIATIRHFPLGNEIPDFRKALALNPNLAQAHFYLGTVYLQVGLLDKALSEMNAVSALDPYFLPARNYVALIHLYQQRYDEALMDYQRSPDFPPGLLWQKVLILFHRGEKAAAYELISELGRKLPDNENVASTYAVLLAAEGKKEPAEEQIGLAIRTGERRHNFKFAEYNIASAYALMGDRRQALQWLRRTEEHRLSCYPLFAGDPNLDNLRSDPDFKAWLAEMKALWEQRRASL